MKDANPKTNVMRILEQHKLAYSPHFYQTDVGPEGTDEYGLHIANSLGCDPAACFKTLVAKGASGAIYMFELPVCRSLDLKKAAKAAGEKSVELLHVAQINEVTGYVRGGCSPIGAKKPYPVIFHISVADFPTVFISAGKIGAQVELTPQALLEVTKAKLADIIA